MTPIVGSVEIIATRIHLEIEARLINSNEKRKFSFGLRWLTRAWM